MKILLIGPPLNTPGGIQNYLRNLIIQLKKRNLSVLYFTQSFKLKDGLMFYPFFIIQFLKFMIRIKESKPNIVHLNPSLIWLSIIRDFFFLNISKKMIFPTIIFIRGWRWSLFERIEKNPILRNLFLKNIKKANKIIVLSSDFKSALVELGVDKDSIICTSTMVESNYYLSINKSIKKPYNILYCGYMARYKGPYELLNAIPQVLKHEMDVNFIFMGDGPELENLQIKTKEMELEKYVSFIGYKNGEEKYDIFKKSHIFVLPSYTEGFPNVVLEAMAAGLPIIATPVGGVKEAIKDEENGFLIESNPPNPNDISNKILKMIKDPNMMAKMSKFNIKEVKRKYDVKVVTKEIEKIYETILNR